MRPRLFAVDLDGTLLRRDGSIDPRDVAALRRARDAGVTVTIATGRLTTGTLPTARALGLEAPLVCGDGATLLCAKTAEILERNALTLSQAESILRIFSKHSLAPFVFVHDAIHCDDAGAAHKLYVRGWSDLVHVHPSLDEAESWRAHGDVAMTLAIGRREDADAAQRAIESALGEHVVSTSFTVADRAVVRGYRLGCSKGSGIERLCARLGVDTGDVAVVGDWWNDLPMFAVAKRSFAMAGAPEQVSVAATDRLQARAGEGGGVAEAIDRWL